MKIFPEKLVKAGTKLVWFTRETNMAVSVRLQDTHYDVKTMVLSKTVSSEVFLYVNNNKVCY